MEYGTAVRTIKHLIENDANNFGHIVVDFLHDNFSQYSWVGIYLVEGNELVLGPWKGPSATAHVRIPIGQGFCGAAAASGETELVDDVHADSRYLACFKSTRSEIVVPIKKQSIVVGEIDIDSDLPGAFTKQDRVFLEEIAGILSNFM